MTQKDLLKRTSVVHRVQRASDERSTEGRLQRQMMLAIAGHADSKRAIESLFAIVCEHHPQTILAFMERDSSHGLRVSNATDLLAHLPAGCEESLQEWADETCKIGDASVHELSGADQWWIVTAPVIRQGFPPNVICAAIKKSAGMANRIQGCVQMAASHLTLFEVLQTQNQERIDAKQSAALLDLVSKLDECDDWTKTAFVLVSELQKHLDCEQVALGMSQGKATRCKVAAVSGISNLDTRSTFSELLSSAMSEALLRRKITVVDRSANHHDEGTLAHQELLRESRSRVLISTPLFDRAGKPVGVWVQWNNETIDSLNETLAFSRLSQGVLGTRLQSVQRLSTHSFKRAFRRASQAKSRNKWFGLAIACILVVLLIRMPADYKISCNCQLEPVLRRFVAAPYDGLLQESLVEAGDVVVAGQTLARMDGRELKWELSGYEADFKSERKKRDAASARDDVALAQQSDLEMQRLNVKMELLRNRLSNLDIKSPIDGVVIEGDLKKAEGVPLSIGQNLFEIGPLDHMIVEVAVPENEVLYVDPGMPVEIHLDADLMQTKTGTLLRTSPRSEIRGNNSVFIAEVALSNDDGRLRPGMKGSVTIISHRRPLGWNWFHHAWESFAMFVGI